MNEIWTFSPSSRELLQKCLAAAGPPDENSEWVKEFKRKTTQQSEIDKIDDSPSIEEMHVENPNLSIDEAQKELTCSEEDFLASIEKKKIIEYEDITNKNLSNNFLITLADKLPVPSVNAWLKHILSSPIKDDTFIEKLLTIFFPVFLKNDYSRFCLNFLMEISKLQQVYYVQVLNILLNNVNIPEIVLHDFVSKLDEGGRSEFMNHLTSLEFSSDIFERNLPSIIIVYNDCIKSNTVEDFVLQCLMQYAEFCKSNKHYGELLLQCLHNEVKMKRTIDVNVFSNLIEKHTTVYKRLCMKTLQEIIEK